MPYKSDRQRRFFHAAEGRGDIAKKTVKEFDQASKGMELPDVIKKYLGGAMKKYSEGGTIPTIGGYMHKYDDGGTVPTSSTQDSMRKAFKFADGGEVGGAKTSTTGNKTKTGGSNPGGASTGGAGTVTITTGKMPPKGINISNVGGKTAARNAGGMDPSDEDDSMMESMADGGEVPKDKDNVKQAAGQGTDQYGQVGVLDKIKMAMSGIDRYTGKPKKYFGGGIVSKKDWQPNPDMFGQEYENQYGEPRETDESQREFQPDPDMEYELGEQGQDEEMARLWSGGYADGGEYEGEDEFAGDQAEERELSSADEDEEDLEQNDPTEMESHRLGLAMALRKRRRG